MLIDPGEYTNTDYNEFKPGKDLMENLYMKYAGRGVRVARIHAHAAFILKKYSWIFVTESSYFSKRVMDIVMSLVLMLLLSPLFILTALAIWIEDRGPVFFTQVRAGKWGKPFAIYKFRSMRVGADKVATRIPCEDTTVDNGSAEECDPRMALVDNNVTVVGRIIRMLSIDELPQLWNVAKGDMSLVGPRPHRMEEVDRYKYSYRRRLNAVPGLTCFCQVSGRKDTEFMHQVALDVQYIESLSLYTDVIILLKTIPAILMSKGAH